MNKDAAQRTVRPTGRVGPNIDKGNQLGPLLGMKGTGTRLCDPNFVRLTMGVEARFLFPRDEEAANKAKDIVTRRPFFFK